VIGQPAEATLVTLKVKPTFSDIHENIVFAACVIMSDLQANVCDADVKSLRDLSVYYVLKPSVESDLDANVKMCEN